MYFYSVKTLGEEIQQLQFRDIFHECALNVMYTANVLQAHVGQFLKVYSLSPAQYNVLRILRGSKGKPMSILQINARMLDRASNTSRIVDKLLEKKLVSRTISKDDRRQVDVEINKSGLDLLTLIDNDRDPLGQYKHAIGETEAHTLNLLLNKFRNH